MASPSRAIMGRDASWAENLGTMGMLKVLINIASSRSMKSEIRNSNTKQIRNLKSEI